MTINFGRVAVLAPHTDDGELGLGATIYKLIAEGVNIRYYAFSSAYESLLNKTKGDVLVKELIQATSVLGLKSSEVEIYKYKVRRFTEFRQEILDDLIKIRQDFAPDTVFTPAIHDVHQDHGTVTREAFRAFKNTNLLGYELPWNNFQFKPQLSVNITDYQLEQKIEALKCYCSQKHRSYMAPEFTKSQAKFRGVQAGNHLSEVFEVYKCRVQ